MQIHELNNYSGSLGSGSFLAVDDGSDTGKVSVENLLMGISGEVSQLDEDLNARIDNIIAGGDAPSAAEVTDARLGAYNTPYASLGAAIRGQIKEISEKTVNLINIDNWSSPNSSMAVSNGVITNTLTDTRSTLFLRIDLYNAGTLVETIYDAQETTRHRKITFTASGSADTIRIIHSGSAINLTVALLNVSITSGQTYTLSFDITGATPNAVGGIVIKNVQLEIGSSETEYMPFAIATDYEARNRINAALPFLYDEMYASRYLLTATDYLTLSGKYIGTTGVQADSANHNASDFIKVHQGDVVTYTLRGSNNSVSVVYMYDNNKDPYNQVALATAYNQDVSGTYTVPIDGYIRISNRVDFDAPVFKIGTGGALLGIKKLIEDIVSVHEDYPSYWNDAMSQAIDRYYEKSELVADHGVSFAYVTDTHWAFNAKNSSKLISSICERTNINVAVHGGDFVRYGKDDIYGFMQYIDKSVKFLPVIGNHEYDASLQDFNLGQVYAYSFKQSETLFTHRQGFNYCYDDNAQKVRFISLNYNDPNCISYLEAWASELASGWSIIVLSHMYWEPAARGSTPTITQIGDRIADKIDELSGTIAAEFVLFLVGHVHRDLNTTTATGVPIVSTNTDAYADSQSYDWGGYKMYADDTTSQCIDLVNIDTQNKMIYMTRLGVGSDRSFAF